MAEERWAGGSVRTGKRGKRWVIERMVNGKRYKVTLPAQTEREALIQLAQWEQDPDGFEGTAARAQPAPLNADLARAVLDAHRHRTPGTWEALKTRLLWWSQELGNRDLRRLTVKEIEALARKGDPSSSLHNKRISALSACYRQLIRDGKADFNPALSAKWAPRTVRPLDERAHTIAEVEKGYRDLKQQHHRDVLRVRVCTGLHLTEIVRIAKGEGRIRIVNDPNIAAVVEVPHKIGHTHQQSINAATLAALQRLSAGRFPSQVGINRALFKVGLSLARLRHTYLTVASERGKVIYPTQGEGVPMELVMQTVGHKSMNTTKGTYLGTTCPILIEVPFVLTHPDDPSEQ